MDNRQFRNNSNGILFSIYDIEKIINGHTEDYFRGENNVVYKLDEIKD